jgi:hypothetical protein
MTTPSNFTGDQLTTALHVLGVDFVMGKQLEKGFLYKKPVSLIAALQKALKPAYDYR